MLTRKRAISGGRWGEEDNVPTALGKKGREVDAEGQIERQGGSGVARQVESGVRIKETRRRRRNTLRGRER